VSFGWSGTAAPSKAGYWFSPASRSYNNVSSNQTNENYTGTVQTFIISGTVTDSGGAAMSGVVITGLPGNPMTDSAGNYNPTVSYGWSGTATPTKTGYSFSPASRSYPAVTGNHANQNYIGATSPKYVYVGAVTSRSIGTTDPWPAIDPTTQFYYADDPEHLCIRVELNDVYKNEDYSPLIHVECRFYRPDGQLYGYVYWDIPNPTSFAYWTYYICYVAPGWFDAQNYRFENWPGRWTCNVYIDDGEGGGPQLVEVMSFDILERPPDTPSLLNPPDAAIGVMLTPTLEASSFSDPDGATHANSHWQLDDNGGFTSPEWDTGESYAASTQVQVPAGLLTTNTTYYWRVRYRDHRGAWSGWASSYRFTTLNRAPDTPMLISPPDGASAVGLMPTLQASAFFDPDGDTHANTHWQVDNDSNFDSPEWDSGDNYSASVSATVPSGALTYNATYYYWRVRYKDSNGAWSNWPAANSFRVSVSADLDGDGDVDQTDFGYFQRCLTGPGIPQNTPECLGARLDTDTDVDHSDFGIFQGCMSGANVPADPNCAD
jgi:hypothetical protein